MKLIDLENQVLELQSDSSSEGIPTSDTSIKCYKEVIKSVFAYTLLIVSLYNISNGKQTEIFIPLLMVSLMIGLKKKKKKTL